LILVFTWYPTHINGINLLKNIENYQRFESSSQKKKGATISGMA